MPSLKYRGEPLFYEAKGKGRAIVLIHGFLGNSQLWSKIAPDLAKRFKVICIDLPGHGNSAPLGYLHSMEMFAEAIKYLLDHLKIRKAVVVGHSLGGYAALAFAEANPDHLLGLVMVNSTAKGDNPSRGKARSQLIKLLKENKDQALRQVVPHFFQLKHRSRHWHVKKYLQWARECQLQSIIACIEGMKIRKEREIILKFAPYPFLYLIGEHDPIFPNEDLQKEAELSEKGSMVLLQSSSHMAPMECPLKVSLEIIKFMKTLS